MNQGQQAHDPQSMQPVSAGPQSQAASPIRMNTVGEHGKSCGKHGSHQSHLWPRLSRRDFRFGCEVDSWELWVD
jgi:hypothetical protein